MFTAYLLSLFSFLPVAKIIAPLTNTTANHAVRFVLSPVFGDSGCGVGVGSGCGSGCGVGSGVGAVYLLLNTISST